MVSSVLPSQIVLTSCSLVGERLGFVGRPALHLLGAANLGPKMSTVVGGSSVGCGGSVSCEGVGGDGE
eukprot:5733405-Heterocapsa_arctica.AAC.1